MAGRQSIYEKIAESTAKEPRNPRPSKGEYVLLVKQLQHKEDGFNGESFIFDFTVESARKISEDAPTPVDSTVTFVWNVTKNQYALGEIKACLAAIAGEHPSAMNGNKIRNAVSEAQPATGARVGCRVADGAKINPNTNAPYVNASFFSVA